MGVNNWNSAEEPPAALAQKVTPHVHRRGCNRAIPRVASRKRGWARVKGGQVGKEWRQIVRAKDASVGHDGVAFPAPRPNRGHPDEPLYAVRPAAGNPFP